MTRKSTSKGPADAQKHLSITVYPWSTHSTVDVAVGWRDADGAHRSRLAYWHVRLTRADLAGHATDDVLRAILERILHRLDTAADPADRQSAVGPGAPLGATGGTVTTDPQGPGEPTLPGL